MTAPIPEPRPEEEQPAGPQPAGPGPDGVPAGLDYGALVAALAASGALDTDPGEQDGELADWLAAEAEGRLEPCDPAAVAAVAVEHMDPGPALAGWLEVAAGGRAGWMSTGWPGWRSRAGGRHRGRRPLSWPRERRSPPPPPRPAGKTAADPAR